MQEWHFLYLLQLTWLFLSTQSLPHVTCLRYPSFFMLSSHSCSCLRTDWLCSAACLQGAVEAQPCAAPNMLCPSAQQTCEVCNHVQHLVCLEHNILLILAEVREWVCKEWLFWFGIISYLLYTQQCEFTAGSEHNKFGHYQHRYIFTEQSIVSMPRSLCLINVHFQQESGWTLQRAQYM